jgi:hypothetical protein
MTSAAKTLWISFVQCRGTPYEVGRAQADAFAETRKGKAFLRKKIRLPPWFDIRNEDRAFKAYMPARGRRSAESPRGSTSRWRKPSLVLATAACECRPAAARR